VSSTETMQVFDLSEVKTAYDEACPTQGEHRSESLDVALEAVATGNSDQARALIYLATNALLYDPQCAEATETFVDYFARFKRSSGMPDKDHVVNRTLLAATMGVTHFFVAREALIARRATRERPKLGPVGGYTVHSHIPGEPMIVAPYETGAPMDLFMRSAPNDLVDAALLIKEQSRTNESPYSGYLPVWDLECNIRQRMTPVASRSNTQWPSEKYPLESDVIRQATVQFVRNTGHFILLVAGSLPGVAFFAVQRAVFDRVYALEAAASHHRDQQRACFGIPGAEGEQRDAYDRIRRGHLTDGMPHLARIYGNRDRWVVAGLEKPPHYPSMCSGQSRHQLPEWMHWEGMPDLKDGISPIGMIALWATEVARYTLLKDRVGLIDGGL